MFDNCPDDCDISMIVGEIPSSPEKSFIKSEISLSCGSAGQFGSFFFENAIDNIKVEKGFKKV